MKPSIIICGGGLNQDLRVLAAAIARGEILLVERNPELEAYTLKPQDMACLNNASIIPREREPWRRGRPLKR